VLADQRMIEQVFTALMTQRAWTSPGPPAVRLDFPDSAYQGDPRLRRSQLRTKNQQETRRCFGLIQAKSKEEAIGWVKCCAPAASKQ